MFHDIYEKLKTLFAKIDTIFDILRQNTKIANGNKDTFDKTVKAINLSLHNHKRYMEALANVLDQQGIIKIKKNPQKRETMH